VLVVFARRNAVVSSRPIHICPARVRINFALALNRENRDSPLLRISPSRKKLFLTIMRQILVAFASSSASGIYRSRYSHYLLVVALVIAKAMTLAKASSKRFCSCVKLFSISDFITHITPEITSWVFNGT